MTWIILALFMHTDYHTKPVYNEKQQDSIEMVAIMSVRELNHKWCKLTMNYYGNQEYFFYEEICKEKYWLKEVSIRKIVWIDIENLEYYRFSETEF